MLAAARADPVHRRTRPNFCVRPIAAWSQALAGARYHSDLSGFGPGPRVCVAYSTVATFSWPPAWRPRLGRTGAIPAPCALDRSWSACQSSDVSRSRRTLRACGAAVAADLAGRPIDHWRSPIWWWSFLARCPGF